MLQANKTVPLFVFTLYTLNSFAGVRFCGRRFTLFGHVTAKSLLLWIKVMRMVGVTCQKQENTTIQLFSEAELLVQFSIPVHVPVVSVSKTMIRSDIKIIILTVHLIFCISSPSQIHDKFLQWLWSQL